MNRKSFRYFLILVLCVAIFPLAFVFSPQRSVSALSDNCTVTIEENVLTGILGTFNGTKVESLDDAYDVLDELKDKFGYSSSRSALYFDKKVQSISGNVYRFKQLVNGIQVYGGEVNLSVKKNGRVTSVLGKYFLDVNYDKTIKYQQEDALKVVESSYSSEAEINFLQTYIYDFEGEDGCVVYVFNVSTIGEAYNVFVSAVTNEIVLEVVGNSLLRDKLPTSGYSKTIEQKTYVVDGKSYTVDVTKYTRNIDPTSYFYVLSNTEKKIFMTNGENSSNYSYLFYDDTTGTYSFNDDDAIKAYYALLKCYDFYADINSFGVAQEGIKNTNGKTIDLIAIVHFDSKYENAGYSAPSGDSVIGYFIFGDGDPANGTKSFVNGIDIVGHEYQHAFTEEKCPFVYSGESGALSEAFSDMFGAVIEGKGISSTGFWQMGEDVISGTRRVFRDMANPTSTGCAGDYETFKRNVASCAGKYTSANDYGRIHYNCTLPTYATYLMYQKNPKFFTEYNILQLWYETLTKLTSTSGFDDFCDAMVKAAEALDWSDENRRIIESVFASIGVPGYTGVETWNGKSLTILQGSGTIESPYLVNTVSDLASVAYYVNRGEGNYSTARYKLSTDIILTADVDWIAIGTEANPFNGYFNGSSNTIHYQISASSSAFGGLFGYCGTNAYIYDLYVDGANVETSSEYAGAIAMQLKGSLSGCSSSLNITGKYVGGLVGHIISSDSDQKIANCFATGTLSGEEVGGLVCHFETVKNPTIGIYESGTIFSSYFSGKISANLAGGLVARANGILLINNIVNTKINSLSNANACAGGLVGLLQLDNLFNSALPTGVLSYALYNKVVVSFENSTNQDKTALLAGQILGSAGQGYIYLSHNTLKNDSKHSIYNSTASSAILLDEENVLSTDSVFSGDFDFDNESYYATSNWFLIQGSTAFDMTATFKVNANKMPTFCELEFWLDDAIYNFAGSGTEVDPFQISNARQLAGLANLMTNEYYYSSYSNKYYILTKDIDLKGKVWAGIGVIRYSYSSNILEKATIFGFTGSFNGNGHTISNVTTLGLYSISKGTAEGDFELYEFNPGFFGVVSTKDTNSQFLTQSVIHVPEIKDLVLEDVVSTGNNAGSVVSKVFNQVNISSVTAMNVSVSSNGIAGGLVGRIDGTGNTYFSSTLESKIENCYVLGTISGVVVGGVVGYATNVSQSNNSSVSIVNFLLRGQIQVLSSEHDAEYDSSSNSASYYSPIAGSMVGVTMLNNLEIVNCISLADIVSYAPGANLGGFVGGVGVGDKYASLTFTILIDGSKQIGNIYDVFNKTSAYVGSVVGITHDIAGTLNLTITSSTYTNMNSSVVHRNNMSSVNLSSSINYSEDEKGTGDFAIYDNNYYKNSKYFNTDNAWGEDQTARLYFTVIFYNDGEIYGEEQIVKENERVVAPLNPTKTSTAQYDYIFKGWDQDFSTITRNMKIVAQYDKVLRTYEITYLDENGHEVDSKILEYGSSVNQNIDPPQKKGNLFVEYEFVRWGEPNQTVTGEMSVSAVYQPKLTKLSVGLVAIVVFVLFILIVVFVKKKSRV